MFFSQRSTFFTSSNHGLQRKGERDEAVTEMGVDSSKLHWVFLVALYFFTSTNRGLRERVIDRKKAGRKSSAFLGLIIF